MYHCRYCGVQINPTPAQLKRRDYKCKACWRDYMNIRNSITPGQREKNSESTKKWIAENREAVRLRQSAYNSQREVQLATYERTRRYRKDPITKLKNDARRLTQAAVKLGVLHKMPCYYCDETKVEAHHQDYNNPLDIIWLCRAHHEEVHLTCVVVQPKQKESTDDV